MISLVNIKKSYKKSCDVLNGINLDISSPSLCLIVGKSGSGKTTLLNILAGLDTPTDGKVIYDDVEMTKKNSDAFRNGKIGFVFQQMNLIGFLSLRDNLRFAFDLCKEKMTEKKVQEIFESVGLPDNGISLDEFLKRKPNELSVGQMQRFSIARALVKNPEVLILDEPTSSLDEENSKEIAHLLKTLSLKKTIIVSSHQKDLFFDLSDQVVEIKDGSADILKKDVEKPKETNKKTNSIRKGFLSFADTLKFSLVTLKKKKMKLATSFIISSITAVLFSMALLFQTFDSNKVLLQTQFKHGQLGAFITNTISYYDHDSYFEQIKYAPFNDDQISKITEYTQGYAFRVGEFWNKNYKEFRDIFVSSEFYSGEHKYYVNGSFDPLEIKPELAEGAGLIRCPKLSKTIENRFPETYDEIAISTLNAELILKHGLVEERNKDGSINKVFYPQRMDDIIGRKTFLGITIVGIFSVTDGSEEYWRPYFEKEPEFDKPRDYEHFNDMANGSDLSRFVYVKPGFAKQLQAPDYYYHEPTTYYVKLKGSFTSDYRFLKSLSRKKNNHIEIANMYSGCTYIISVFYGYTRLIAWIAIFILIIVSLCLSLNLFYSNVKAMEKDLGILKAMGGSKPCIASIISLQSLIVSLVEMALSLIALGIIIPLINSKVQITLFSLSGTVLLSLFSLLVLIALAVSFLASRKALLGKTINIIEGK